MTDQAATTEPEDDLAHDEVTDATDNDETDDNARRHRRRDPDSEAATRRRQLRAAEEQNAAVTAERDRLAARLEHMQRAEAERIASSRLAIGKDLWDVGDVDLDDVLDDNGDVDPALVETAVAALIETRPGLATPPPRYPDMGAGRRGATTSAPTWADVMRRG
ncbi:hypothetical protein [Mobilicoccus massiliensis]|uniref:hypothetical protein n=1 Tax=Mobilicoccus massiliensis TaxID=1522310 RepID=UPI00069342D5|nr:hypothetical protein [Mobilicoccus massiliensis]